MNKKLGIFCLALMGLFACNSPKENKNDTFNRGEMLKNYADNLILPAFTDLQKSVKNLAVKIDTLITTQNSFNLNKAQVAWLEAYTSWQYVNAYNFGPGGAEGIRRALIENIATFPVSESKIATAIENPNFNDFNRDTRGFLAVEYLIYEGDQTTIFNRLADEKSASYLKELVKHIEDNINSVLTAWNGSYRSEFLSNTGTDVGSSTSQLYNEFIKSFESKKNIKIELPLGKRPGQTQVEPKLVEAYYSGKSLELLATHLTAIYKLYNGESKNGTKGLGFVDYLKTVEGGTTLVASTQAQWQEILSAFNVIPLDNPLSDQVVNNFQTIDNFRIELQKHTRFFKSDMSSILGIAITFSSGDGD